MHANTATMPRALCGDAVVRLESVRRHVRAVTAPTRPQYYFARYVWRYDVSRHTRLGPVFCIAAVVLRRDFATVNHNDALHPADSSTDAFPAPVIADPDAHSACGVEIQL
jgi:hypothetical protein